MSERNAKFVWQDALRASKLTGNALAIGFVMSTVWDGKTPSFFLSYDTIAEWTGLHKSTIKANVTALREAGWIERISRGGRHGTETVASVYRCTIPKGHLGDPSTGEESQGTASTYLIDPSTSLLRNTVTRNSESGSSTGEESQGTASTYLIDPSTSLLRNTVTRNSESGSSTGEESQGIGSEPVTRNRVDLSSLSTGDQITRLEWEDLEPLQRVHFAPDFISDDFVYTSPSASGVHAFPAVSEPSFRRDEDWKPSSTT